MHKLSFSKKKVAILGGGISGISAALFLREKDPNIQIHLFEKTNRLGGWIQSLEGEYPFELGPRTLSLARSSYFLKLIKLLELEEEIIVAKGSSKRYLCKEGQLLSLPPDAISFIKSPLFYLSLFITILLEPFRKRNEEEETIASFFQRRLGRKIGIAIAESLAKGVFGGDPHKLSMSACFPSIKSMEDEGLLKSMLKKTKHKSPKGLFSLERGLETIARRFEEKKIAEILLESEVTSIERIEGEQGFLIKGENEKRGLFEERFDRVILALPPKALYSLLKSSREEFSLQNEMEFLKSIPTESLTLVLAHIEKCEKGPRGFGFLKIGSGDDPLLGCVFDSEIFPRAGEGSRFTFMLRGTLSEDEARKRALLALREILKIKTPPSCVIVHHCSDSIPQYLIGHEEKWRTFLDKIEEVRGFYCIGTSGGGVSLEDCSRKGFTAAERLVKELRVADESQSEGDLQMHSRGL